MTNLETSFEPHYGFDWIKHRRVTAVGKMGLTNFIMHSVIVLFSFSGDGLAIK